MKKTAKVLFLLILNFGIFTILIAQNNCLDFDGTDDYLDIGTGPGTVKTIEFWLNSGTTTEYLIDLNGANYIWISASTITATGFSSPTIYVNGKTETSIAANIWHHIAVTTSTGINASDFDIGRQGANYMTGKIDEVRIWSDVRTEAEIRTNMYKELAGTETGLVAYYKFNETTGTTADNAEGTSSLDGTLTGTGFSFDNNAIPSPAFAGPKNCLDFDPDLLSYDYVDLGGTTILDQLGEGDYTIEAWIKSSGAILGKQTIIGNYNGTPAWGLELSDDILTFGGGEPIMYVNNEAYTSPDDVDDGNWHHIAGVRDMNTNIIIYIDGIEVYNNGSDPEGSFTVSNNTNIARVPYTISHNYFDGQIDEVRIWNTARTIQQIHENMCKNLTGNENGLVAYYNFDNASGTILQDLSSNSNDGTLTNMENSDWVSSTAFNTWLNVDNINWETNTNWSDGQVPTSADNVGIPYYSSGSHPTIASASECNNLVVGDDVTLTFNYNGSHTIHGSAFVIGHSDITNGDFLTVTRNLYILPLSSLDIDPGGQLTIGNKLNNWGTCTIKSSASSTGSFIVNSTSSSINCERYLASGKWHYIAEPINTSGYFSTLNLGLTAGANNDQFYRWEESLSWGGNVGIWVDILNGPNGNNSTMTSEGFVKAKGYGIYYKTTDKTLSLSGVPYTSNETINITRTSGSTAEGWNQIGNPFCSTLAGNSNAETTNNFITANSAQLDGSFAAVYLWNEQASYPGNRDDYINFSNSDVAKYIEVGQAFMVKSKAGGGTISFNSNNRKHGTATFYKNTMRDEVSRFYMSVSNQDGLYNEILIAFMEGMTKGLDKSYDAGKLKGNPDIAFYSVLVEDNEIDFAHQALPPLGEEKVEVKIGLDVSEAGDYKFKLTDSENFDETISIKLEDKETGELIDFREIEEYSFNISTAGEIRGRFVLHFKSTVGIEEQDLENENIRFYVYDNKLYIIDEELKNGTIQLYNLPGQMVMEKKYSGQVITIDLDLSTGYYIVKIITDKASINGKIYIE